MLNLVPGYLYTCTHLKWNEVKELETITLVFSARQVFKPGIFHFSGEDLAETLCDFSELLKSQRKSPSQVALYIQVSDFVEQFALQSPLFSRSFSFWHLLSHCGFTICYPVTLEELFLEDGNKGTEGHTAAAGCVL